MLNIVSKKGKLHKKSCYVISPILSFASSVRKFENFMGKYCVFRLSPQMIFYVNENDKVNAHSRSRSTNRDVPNEKSTRARGCVSLNRNATGALCLCLQQLFSLV